MKKYSTYIFIFLIVAAIIALIATGNNKKNRHINSRVTFRKQDKNPYGMYVAYENLKNLFPGAYISADKYEPGYWDSLSTYGIDQALIIVTDRFTADEAEIKKLLDFAEHGNDIFITARVLSYDVEKILKCRTNDTQLPVYYNNEEEYLYDSLTVQLVHPPFEDQLTYTYPGRGISSSFSDVDTTIADILGRDKNGNPDFIHLQAGQGNLFIHLAPISFSNYFLLHKNNFRYYEKVFSLINPDVKTIVWDEFYLNRNTKNNKKNDKSWLSVLFKYPSLKAALLTAIIALLAYVLFEMRRKQRIIPVLTKPKNDSLDFVKTIGRLYYDKGDHKNLCKKMSAYYLEHIRNKYKLPTGKLDDEFINNLVFKSGADEQNVRGIISFIKSLDTNIAVSPFQVADFHKQLESFYKIT